MDLPPSEAAVLAELTVPDVGAPPPGQAGPRPAGQSRPGRTRRLARGHWPFGVLLLAGIAIRVIAMVGYRGALRTPDTTRYLRNALHLAPGTVRPSGYSVLLRLLEPLHSFAAVAAVQHAMGLAVVVIGYLLLVRAGLPGWGAAIAMAPPLLSAYAVQLEQFLLSDTLFALLLMIAVALTLWWRQPPAWACAVTGLLVAAAALTRSEGTPLLAVFAVYLLVRFARWRTVLAVAALCAAFGAPVAGYAAWYSRVHGSFELTSSSGAFLYGGAATFADCARFTPPAAERRLCLSVPVGRRKWSDYYIFAGPLAALPGGPFGAVADRLGRRFALQAIKAQPLDYLRAFAGTLAENFEPPPSPLAASAAVRNRALHFTEYLFPATPPKPASPGTARMFSRYDPAGPGLHVVQPYAGWVRAYQRYVIVPGPLLAVIALVGLGGLLAGWRRLGGPALLPWLIGTGLLAIPAAIIEAYPRYVVGVVPFLCVAAALGARQIAASLADRRASRPSARHSAPRTLPR